MRATSGYHQTNARLSHVSVDGSRPLQERVIGSAKSLHSEDGHKGRRDHERRGSVISIQALSA